MSMRGWRMRQATETTMNLLLWLMAGLATAWLSCWWQSTLCHQRLFVHAVFAAVGALLGGLSATPSESWLSADTHWAGLAGAMLGAAVLLWLVTLRARQLRRRD
jgi:uncharacterized membrane protein YeaQ/YmgE (transglycosylase-associated protein family)